MGCEIFVKITKKNSIGFDFVSTQIGCCSFCGAEQYQHVALYIRMYVCTLCVQKKRKSWKVAEFCSQTPLNIVDKVIEVGELDEGNISAAAGK